MKKERTSKFLSLFLFIQIAIVQLLAYFPEYIERYYANGLYLFISKFNRILFGWMPFSFGDVLYTIIGIYLFILIIKALKRKQLKVYNCIAFLSIIYFIFHLFWGLNYHRIHLAKRMNFENLNYNTADLEELSCNLIAKVNELQVKITGNDTVKVTVPYNSETAYKLTVNGFDNLSEEFPFLAYQHHSIKNSLYSTPLSFSGFTGYLNPFTHEAQVNKLPPKIQSLFVSCHEVGHQLGYAAENEANFIGVLASISNDDLYFKYSGYCLALRYTLKELYNRDKEKFEQIYYALNTGTLKNFEASRDFWGAYKNPFKKYFKGVYNIFLKANNQDEGIKSYNLMVGMLINYNKKENSILKD